MHHNGRYNRYHGSSFPIGFFIIPIFFLIVFGISNFSFIFITVIVIGFIASVSQKRNRTLNRNYGEDYEEYNLHNDIKNEQYPSSSNYSSINPSYSSYLEHSRSSYPQYSTTNTEYSVNYSQKEINYCPGCQVALDTQSKDSLKSNNYVFCSHCGMKITN